MLASPGVGTDDGRGPPAAPLLAGYQEVEGAREVPVLGAVTTRSRTWFLARWLPDGDHRVLAMRTCGVEFDRVLGAKVELPSRALARLPVVRAPFRARADGSLVSAAWSSGWQDDLDEDRRPGVSIHVDAPVCSGQVYVTSEARSSAVLFERGGTFEGRLRVRVKQRVLGASNDCLRRVSEDSDEELSGRLRLVPVPGDATCGRWSSERWPARR